MKASVFFFKFPLESSLGGAEFHTLKLAQHFQSQGHKVKLFTSDSKLFRLFEKDYLTRKRLFVGWEPTAKWSLLLWPVTYLVARAKFKKLLKEIPQGSVLFMQSLIEKLVLTPLMIHNSSQPPLTLRGGAPSLRVREGGGELLQIIWLEHKIPGRWLKLNPLKFRYLKLASRIQIITVSNFAKQEFIKLGVAEANLKVIYPTPSSSPPYLRGRKKEGVFTIGLLSRLDPEKGILDFLKIILPELKNHPNWEVLIAGEGPQQKDLESIIDNYNLGNQIKLLGFVNNLDEFFAQISVLVYPTKVPEAFGIAVLEATARGIPVVASNLGALPEIIKPGKNGLLVNPASPSSWKKFIEVYSQINAP